MHNIIYELVARDLRVGLKQVERTAELLDGCATVPFISRYRKEATGGLDEVQVAAVGDKLEKLRELQKRKETIVATIEAQGKLTPELQQRITDCWDATQLEDIYLPYKPKRKTRAEAARKLGLEPLADAIMLRPFESPEKAAQRFLGEGVETVDDALQGARDIIAERINENEHSRNIVRRCFRNTATITSKVVKGKEAEAAKYKDYFDFSEPLRKCGSHRLLAMRRGEAEGFLKIAISPADDAECMGMVERNHSRSGSPAARQIALAAADAYKRLLRPSIENEFAALSRQKAEEEAIKVFQSNLRQLLLSAPLGQKRIMGIDPGYRTGCKVVCLDAQGNLLHNENIYPHPPRGEMEAASQRLAYMARHYAVEAIAVGNGTAGRETEALVRSVDFGRNIPVFVVNEDGASVYSASKIAREEFPDYDVTVRGAVSIARRLADPLSELVKIDPKSIGVGQYQHDVDQGELKKSLDAVVESCVNSVGVNVNTAGAKLLSYVSGLGPSLAANIVGFRAEHGPFAARRDLLKVPRLGAKAYEQCAGFLRIPDAANPLDNTAVHPESYSIVERMAADSGMSLKQFVGEAEVRRKVDLKKYCHAGVGMPTLTDIMSELDKPGRDPRGKAQIFAFNQHLRSIDDVSVGMELPGVVTNITNFGCFVDIGIKTQGLVHISEMADRFVASPSEVVAIQQKVVARVIGIDYERGRISLSLKGVNKQK